MKPAGILIVLAGMCAAQPGPSPADRPVPRTDANSVTAHQQLLEKAKQGRIDLYFEGDSITRRWGATDYPELLANWKQNFFGWNAADFGWGADQIQNILWRLENGELDGVHPKVIVLLAGTNNVGNRPALPAVTMPRSRTSREGFRPRPARDARKGARGDHRPRRRFFRATTIWR